MTLTIHTLHVTRDGTIHIFNFRFDFRYLTHGSIHSQYFPQPRHLSHKMFNPFYPEAPADELQPIPEEIQEILFQPQKTIVPLLKRL